MSEARPLLLATAPHAHGDELTALLTDRGIRKVQPWPHRGDTAPPADVGRDVALHVDWHRLRLAVATGDGPDPPFSVRDLADQLGAWTRRAAWVFASWQSHDAQALTHIERSGGDLTTADPGNVHRTADMFCALDRAWEHLFAMVGVQPLRVRREAPDRVPAELVDAAARRRGAFRPDPDGTAPGFVVVGTGRCGTTFTASALTALGIDCGHESWWTVDPSGRRPGLHGDASWLAVPFLGDYQGAVLHQVRHPLDVIRSLVGIGMFTDPRHGGYQNLAFEHLPGLVGDDLTDAMRWYVGWNASCERFAHHRFRIEDLDASLLVQLAADVGHPVDRSTAVRALADVRLDRNSRRRAGLRWDDLPDGSLKRKLREMADAYGYEVS